MKAEQKIVVNCGASHVSISTFSVGEDRLVLDKTFSESLSYEHSDDYQWLDSVIESLESLTKNNKISGKTHFILPGFLLLTKTIRVPRVEEHKQQQIIEFEAQQNIPYPLTDVVWDSHIVSEDDIDNEALLIAIKKDIAKDFCSRVNTLGLFPVSMGASSILDVNAFHFSGYETADTENLIINIGSRSTNLLFINPSGFLVRTINVGGNTLTQNISDNLGMSFENADDLKIQYFSGELEVDDSDPAVHVMQQASETFFKRLNQEVTRSIVTYKRQKKGKSPTHIFLTGKGSLVGGLSEFIGEKQRVEIDYFQTLTSLTLGSGIDEESMSIDQFNLNEVVGSVARDYVESPVGVNLLPNEFQATQEFNKKKPILIVSALLLAILPFGSYFLKNQEISQKRKFTRMIKNEIPPLEDSRNKIENNITIAEKYKDAINEIGSIVDSKYNWILFLSNIQEILFDIKDVWLDDMKVNRSQGNSRNPAVSYLDLKGRLLVRSEKNEDGVIQAVDQKILGDRIIEFKNGLIASDFIVKEKSSKIGFENLNKGLKVLPFEITFEVNQDKPL
tara:strand:- start:1060 stop:2745 length:1686 start_codon:yes stop_codon:yes gene_type:complete